MTAEVEFKGLLVQSLSNYETVRAFAAERRDVETSREWGLKNIVRLSVRMNLFMAGMQVVKDIVQQSGVFVALLVAANLVASGDTQFTPGKYVMVQMYIVQLFMPLTMVGFQINSAIMGAKQIEKLAELLAVKREVVDRKDAINLVDYLNALEAKDRGAVNFSKVNFTYAKDAKGIVDLSWSIGSGQTLALVGQSGCGKSTCIRLLLRFYEITKGSISVGGLEIGQATQESLRTAVGLVPQETILFNETLLFNIKFGAPNATDLEVNSIIKKVQMQEFVSLQTLGLLTMVGERGTRLSGGERQRIGIARALIRHVCVLVLDEATSALDNTTEKAIQSTVEEACNGITQIVVAHRLSTIMHSHQILVLNAGEIRQSGTHKEMLHEDGPYKRLWERQ